MKIHLCAGGAERDITVVRQGDTLRVCLDSPETRELEAVVVSATAAGIVLEHRGRRIHVIGARGPTGPGARQLWVNGRTLAYRRATGRSVQGPAGDLSLASAIPAVVREILVTEGQRVAEGKRLVLLESMKMVLPIIAGQPGVVRAILCREGEAVRPGIPLVDFEPDGNPATDAK